MYDNLSFHSRNVQKFRDITFKGTAMFYRKIILTFSRISVLTVLAAVLCIPAVPLWPGNSTSFSAEPKPDPPTPVALGVSWIVTGDANRNAEAALLYRKSGTQSWKQGFPLQRQEQSRITPPKHRRGNHYFYRTGIPDGKWRFAGSVWDLEPGTEYDLKIQYRDPDGGEAEKVLTCSTRPIPLRKGPGTSLYTVPGSGGGTGSRKDPYKGLKTAFDAAEPGDNILLNPGTYRGLSVKKNGTPGKAYHFIGLPGGDAVVKGGFNIRGKKYLTFDNLKIMHAGRAFSADGAVGITVRFCRIEKCRSGMHARNSQGFYIADNHLKGPSPWPRSRGIESTAGWDVGGQGHTICHNFISYVADGISCLRGRNNIAIDVFNNEIITCTDEGVELDYAHWNMRVYRNRLTDVYQGISYQPVQGGPTFTFRNIIYNCVRETWKLHDYSSGQWIVNNTTIKKGSALSTSMPRGYGVTNTHMYNNLFIGTSGHYGANFGIDLALSTFDYNALVGDGFKRYIRWNRKGFSSLDQLKGKGPVQAHGYHLTSKDGPLFVKDLAPPKKTGGIFPCKEFDPRLRPGSPAVDKGRVIPAITEGFRGEAPDLGAFELGDPLPHYGPRPYGAAAPPFISPLDAPLHVRAGDAYRIENISFWKAEEESTVRASLLYRKKGASSLKKVMLKKEDNGRYSGEIPGEATKNAFEYFVEFSEKGQKTVREPKEPELVVPDRTPPVMTGGLKLESSKNYGVVFRWQKAEDDKGIAGYHVFRGSKPGFTPEQEEELGKVGTAVLSFTDKKPKPGSTAVYAVRARDVVGRMGEPAYLKVAVPENRPPENSLSLKASPGSRAVNLSWSGELEPDVKRVIILRAQGTGDFAKIAEADPSVTRRYLDKGLKPGESYRYAVKLVDSGGLESGRSEPVSEKPLGFVKRINCGGEKVASADGVDWEHDRVRRSYTSIYTARGAKVKGAGSALQDVYTTERWSYSQIYYAFDVAPGRYRVVLHFAETNKSFAAEGKRVFDIFINDKKVKESYDITAAAGGGFKSTNVQHACTDRNGTIEIKLVKNPTGPSIKGIEIIEVLEGSAED